MPVTSKAFRELQNAVADLEPLATVLLMEAKPGVMATSRSIELRVDPVRLSGFVDTWKKLFMTDDGRHKVRASGASAIEQAYHRLLCGLCETHSGWLATDAYAGTERWLRENTVTVNSSRPHTSLGLIWFVAAAHNWLWWQRYWLKEWHTEVARRVASLMTEGRIAIVRARRVIDWSLVLAACPDATWWQRFKLLREWKRVLVAVPVPEDMLANVPIDLAVVIQSSGMREVFREALTRGPRLDLVVEGRTVKVAVPLRGLELAGHVCNTWLEDHLAEDVDPFLEVLGQSVRGKAGDLIAINLMTANLRRLILPPQPHQVHVAQGKARSAESVSSGPVEMIPAALGFRWATIASFSAVSGLELAGIPRPALELSEGQTWRWLNGVIGDPGAASLRQHLASQLGERLADPRLPVKRIDELLSMLNSLDEKLGDGCPEEVPFDTREGWSEFLAQVLWGTLADMSPQRSPDLWVRWSAGYPGRVTLAQWCGRLARRAEERAQRLRRYDLPEWAWLWRDLAKATLYRWPTERGFALLCLGLWQLGYLEGQETVVPLVLGRQLTDPTLEYLIAHWQGAARIESGWAAPQEGSLEERQRFTGQLEHVHARLQGLSVFSSLRQQQIDRVPKAGKVDDRDERDPPEEVMELDSGARIFRCVDEA